MTPLLLLLGSLCASALRLYDSVTTSVTELKNREDLEATLKTSPLLLLQLYNSKGRSSIKFRDEYLQTARALSGMVTVAALDCQSDENAASCKEEFKTKKLPAIFSYKKNSNGETERATYEGETTSREIVKYAKSLISAEVKWLKDVKEHKKFLKTPSLTEMPHAIFFTNEKDEIPLFFKAMAARFKGRMEFAAIHKSAKKVVKNYDISEWPSIVVIPKSDIELGDGDEPSTRLYNGPMKGAHIAPFIERYAIPLDTPTSFPLVELEDQSCLEAYCTGTGYSLCALLFLDPSNRAEATYFMKQLLLVQQGKSRASGMFTVSFVDQNKQSKLLGSFALEPQSYPQLVIYAQKAGRYSPLVGTVEEKKIEQFVVDVLAGKAGTEPVTLPTLDGEGKACEGHTFAASPSSSSSSSSSFSSSSSSDEETAAMNAKMEEKMMGVEAKRAPRDRKGGDKGVDYSLTADNFDAKVLKVPTGWLVRFIEGDGKDKEVEANVEWQRALRAVKSIVYFGSIAITDKAEQVLAERFGVKVGDVLYFPPSPSGKKTDSAASKYKGEMKGEALRDFANSLIEDAIDLVAIVSAESWSTWFSITPLQPRILFATNKPPPPPLLARSLAIEHYGYLKVAFVHDKKEGALLKELNISNHELPAVFLVQAQLAAPPEGTKMPPGSQQIMVGVQPIPKPFHFNSIARIMDTAVRKFPVEGMGAGSKADEEDILDMDHDEL